MKLAFLVLPALLSCMAGPAAAAVGSLADVAIYDHSSGRELPLHASDGRFFVAGKPGSEYEIRIRNQTAGDLLAVISVDGVNVVSGETASESQSGYVIAAWRRMEIKGWRKDLTRVAAFYFTDLEDSYAARTGRPDNVGVIGVALFRRKVAQPAIIDEQRMKRSESSMDRAANGAAQGGTADAAPPALAQAPEKSLGTGHGRSEASQARYTTFERESDQPNELVAIRYDSYANLVAQGVIRNVPRQPQPFPARFVPDPPARW
jgi:hypothetical protein